VGVTDIVTHPTVGEKDLVAGELEHGRGPLTEKLEVLGEPMPFAAADHLLAVIHHDANDVRRGIGPGRPHWIRHTGDMGERLTLVADASIVAGRGLALPDGLTMRAVADADAEALAQLYLSAYHPSPGAMSLLEAREEMRANFAGESGELWRAASPVVVDANGVVLASVLMVTAAPLDWGRPPGPYVVEVLTSHQWRGRGLAGALLADAARAVIAAGREPLALRVDPDNIGAIRLYAAAGFVGLTEKDADGVAHACAADVGDWRAALRSAQPKPRREGLLGSTDAMSGALSMLAVLAVVGGLAAIVGLVWWVGAMFFSVFADSSTAVSPSPSVSASAAP